MGALRTFAAALFMAVIIPVAAVVVFPWTLITRKIDFLYWVGMRIARGAVWLTGTRVRTQGLENVDPAGTYIFMSNHVSNLDPPILVPLIPRRTSVLAKKEIWRIPVLAQALDLGEIVPVVRHNRDAAIQSIKKAGEVMQHGINMTVYPEGTRSPDGRLLPFKKGPFHLALETGFPIVPVTMLGTFEMMPKGRWSATGGTATVVFHSPIDPKKFSSREELTQAVRDAIESALPPERWEHR
jgi:1-acyl-sn-glycerol-3-phosphate acyltransferase